MPVTLDMNSYVVPCGSQFRDRVLRLAQRRGVSVADLARSVLLLLDRAMIAEHVDPGEPDAADREVVVVRSGRAKDRVLRRKPRLQVRLPAGLDFATIRRTLAIALQLEDRRLALSVDDPRRPGAQDKLADAEEEIIRLRQAIGTLAFEPLVDVPRNRDEALYVLGLPPGAEPDEGAVRQRFRQLARVYHPDTGLGDPVRMTQLNAAVSALARAAR